MYKQIDQEIKKIAKNYQTETILGTYKQNTYTLSSHANPFFKRGRAPPGSAPASWMEYFIVTLKGVSSWVLMSFSFNVARRDFFTQGYDRIHFYVQNCIRMDSKLDLRPSNLQFMP